MATVYLAILGKQGLSRVGELSTAKAHYAAEQLTKIPGVSLRFAQPFFKEFALRLPKSPATVVARLARRRILPGVPLRSYDKTLADSLLVAVTEQRTREEIDAYASALAEVLK
jgi:glycine dehydrogenase subunit 1